MVTATATAWKKVTINSNPAKGQFSTEATINQGGGDNIGKLRQHQHWLCSAVSGHRRDSRLAYTWK